MNTVMLNIGLKLMGDMIKGFALQCPHCTEEYRSNSGDINLDELIDWICRHKGVCGCVYFQVRGDMKFDKV